ncbi:glycosyltransferase [Variovorax sp. 2RAF20]
MKIAYVGPFAFPESHANSLRVHGMVMAMVQAGHEITVCPGMLSHELGKKLPSSVKVHSVDEYAHRSGFSKIPGARGLFIGDATLDWLRSQTSPPDAVILYGTHLSYLLRLQKYCRQKKVKLFLDVVEWYDPRHLPGGLFGPFAAMNEWSMRYAAKKVDGIFVISSYLDKHFASAGCRTLQVPPLFSPAFSEPLVPFRDINGALNICYVGAPGKKEEFGILFAGLRMAREYGVRIYIHMVGVTESEFRWSYPNANIGNDSSDWMKFYGRVPNDAAKLVIASCDFMVVIRQKSRVTQAGFPSKVSESLSLGTPVIANRFGDMEKYIQSGNAGLLLDKLSSEGVCSAISLAAKLNESELRRLKTNARAVAENEFSPANYSEKIGKFLSENLKNA